MPPKTNLIGQRFGRLIVVAPAPSSKAGRARWVCKCDCGKEKICLADNLRSGNTKSCGCIRIEQLIANNKLNPKMPKVKDLTGQRFGKLTVIKRVGSSKSRHAIWLCKCDCGNLKTVTMDDLLRGHTSSCGCLTSSTGELFISDILTKNNIPFKKEYTFPDLYSTKNAKLRFDFAIFNKDNQLKRLVEFDGIQHFEQGHFSEESFEERQLRDKLKNEYCKQHNIPLVRIPYTEKNNITLDMILGNKYLIQ